MLRCHCLEHTILIITVLELRKNYTWITSCAAGMLNPSFRWHFSQKKNDQMAFISIWIRQKTRCSSNSSKTHLQLIIDQGLSAVMLLGWSNEDECLMGSCPCPLTEGHGSLKWERITAKGLSLCALCSDITQNGIWKWDAVILIWWRHELWMTWLQTTVQPSQTTKHKMFKETKKNVTRVLLAIEFLWQFCIHNTAVPVY